MNPGAGVVGAGVVGAGVVGAGVIGDAVIGTGFIGTGVVGAGCGVRGATGGGALTVVGLRFGPKGRHFPVRFTHRVRLGHLFRLCMHFFFFLL